MPASEPGHKEITRALEKVASAIDKNTAELKKLRELAGGNRLELRQQFKDYLANEGDHSAQGTL